MYPSAKIRVSPVLMAVLTLCSLVFVGCQSASVRAQHYFQKGMGYYDQQKFAEAAIDFQNAIKRNPGAWDSHYYLGLSEDKLQHYPTAYQELKTAIELNPSFAPAKLDMADLVLLGGKTKEAREQVEAAEALQGANARSRGLLAKISVLEKDYTGAIKLWEQVQQMAPQDPLAWTACGVTRLQVNQYDAAKKDFRRALELSPDSVETYRNLANLYQLESRPTDAEKVLDAGVLRMPRSLDMQLVLADFYYRQGKTTELANLFTQLKSQSAVFPNVAESIGDFWIWRHELAAGVRELEAEQAQHPDDLVAKKLVSAYITLGRTGDAEKLNQELLKRDPKDPQARAFDGALAYVTHDYGRATVELQEVLKDQPNSLFAMYYLGLSWVGQGNPQRGRQMFQQCVQLNPDFTDALQQLASLALQSQDWEEAAEDAAKVVRLRPTAVDAYLVMIQALIGKHDLRQADAALAALRKMHGPSPDYYELAARVAELEGKDAAADDNLKEALAVSDKPVGVLLRYAAFEKQTGRPREGIKVLKQWAASNAPRPEVEELLAQLYSSVRDFDEAEAACKLALQTDHSRWLPHVILGQILQQRGQQDPALAEYELAIEAAPTKVAPYVLAGDLAMEQGQYDKAKDYYENARKQDPDSAVVDHALARWYADRGQNLDVALSLVQELKKRFPHDQSLSDTLGWIYYQKRLYSLAVQQLAPASNLLPESAEVQFHLGMTYYQLGQPVQARRALQRALQLGLGPAAVPDAKRVLAASNG